MTEKYFNSDIVNLLKNFYNIFLFVGKDAPNGKIENFVPSNLTEINQYYPNYIVNNNMMYGLCGSASDTFFMILKKNKFICRKCFLNIEPFRVKKLKPGFNKRYMDLYNKGRSESIDHVLIPQEFQFLDRNSIYGFTHLVVEYYDIEKNRYFLIDPSAGMVYPYSVEELLNNQLSYTHINSDLINYIQTTDMIEARTLYFATKTFWNTVYDHKYIYA